MTTAAPAIAPTWRASHHSKHVVRVDIDFKRKAGWEQWALLSSDRHHDNPKTKQDLELEHLREAQDRGAFIIDAGDLFCAMQGKWDKRASKDDLRPEHQNGRYLDSLVDTAADFYGPFAKSFAMIGRGNHETAVSKNHETDLTERLVARLNDRHAGDIVPGGYSGFVWLNFRDASFKQSKALWYDHGYGGGGPVTKDVIQTNRRASYLANADIVLSGHTHDHWVLPIRRVKLTQGGEYHDGDYQLHVKTPTYKDDWNPAGGFAKERGHSPKPLGAVWLRFYWKKERGIRVDATWAQ